MKLFLVSLFLVCQTSVLFGANIYDLEDVLYEEGDDDGQVAQYDKYGSSDGSESKEYVDLYDRSPGHNPRTKKAQFHCVEELIETSINKFVSDADESEYEYYPSTISQKQCIEVPKSHDKEHVVLSRKCIPSKKPLVVFRRKLNSPRRCWEKIEHKDVTVGCQRSNGK